MLRYHKFTIGQAWAVEYGNADSARQFPYLYKYSPYHNIRTAVNYPATMITTADHDDRVVPAHSFKFAARLQEYAGPTNELPLLIRIDTDAGHGAGKPTQKLIDEAADIWSFTMYNLGMAYSKSGKGNNAAVKNVNGKSGAAGGKAGGAGNASTEKSHNTTVVESDNNRTQEASGKSSATKAEQRTSESKSKFPRKKSGGN